MDPRNAGEGVGGAVFRRWTFAQVTKIIIGVPAAGNRVLAAMVTEVDEYETAIEILRRSDCAEMEGSMR